MGRAVCCPTGLVAAIFMIRLSTRELFAVRMVYYSTAFEA